MKILLSFLLLILFVSNTKSQEAQLPKKLFEKREIIDCEMLSLNAADLIGYYYNNNKIDSIKPIINHLRNTCGSTEWSLRIEIVNAILNNEDTNDLISSFLLNEYHNVFRYRINNSKNDNYGYFFERNKDYWGFVPFRHPIDIATLGISTRLLNRENLTIDERLICLLFSEDFDAFDSQAYKKSNGESIVTSHLRSYDREWKNSWMAIHFYTGVYSPFGNKYVFNNSPLFGFTFSTPLVWKTVVELGFKFRFNINDKDFDYFALGEMHTVNSDVSIFFGGLIGYKIYESKQLVLMPKFGVGLESVDTGISEKNDKGDDTKYHDVETIHLSLGMSALTPIFRKQHLGCELSYHYTPYQLVENLHTKLNHSSVSFQVFLRF